MISDEMIEWIEAQQLEEWEAILNDESNWCEPANKLSTTA